MYAKVKIFENQLIINLTRASHEIAFLPWRCDLFLWSRSAEINFRSTGENLDNGTQFHW